MCVWLADLQPHTRKSSFELFRQPWTRGEATNEERKLFPEDSEQNLASSRCTNRTGGKALTEVIPDRIHSGFNRGLEEPRNLRAVRVKVWVPIR